MPTHKVKQSRKFQMEAVIGRVTKSRKQIAHNELMTEVLKQLRFTGKPQEIKAHIENLIERSYIERKEDDTAVYEYLA